MACGEGYGAAVLAERAAEVVGVDANPEAHEHARLRYTRAEPALRARRSSRSSTRRALGRDRLPPDDRARRTSRARCSSGSPRCWRPAASPTSARPTGSRSRPPGAERSGNPWHVREYTPPEYRGAARARASRASSCSGCSTRASCALHELALRLGWDRRAPGAAAHAAASTTGSCPAINERDFALRAGALDRALDLLAVCRP